MAVETVVEDDLEQMICEVESVISGSKFKSAMNQLVYGLSGSKADILIRAINKLFVKFMHEEELCRRGDIDPNQHRQLSRLVKMAEEFLRRVFEQEMIATMFEPDDEEVLTDRELKIIRSATSLICFVSVDNESFCELFLKTCQENFNYFPDHFWGQLLEYTAYYSDINRLDWFKYGCQQPNYQELLMAIVFEARICGLAFRPLDLDTKFFNKCHDGEKFDRETNKRREAIGLSIKSKYSRGVRVVINDKYRGPVASFFDRFMEFLYGIKSARRQIRDFGQNLSKSKITRRWHAIRRQVTRGVREHRPHRIGIRWQPLVDLGLTSLEIWRDDDVADYPGVCLRFNEELLTHNREYNLTLEEGHIVGLDGLDTGEPGEIEYSEDIVINWLVLGVYGMIVSQRSGQQTEHSDDQTIIKQLDDCYEVIEVAVSPHLRELSGGESAGEDRPKLCQKLLGIELPDGYTVVRPYERQVHSRNGEKQEPDIYINCPEDPTINY